MTWLLKLCLDRLCAPLRPTDNHITIDGLDACTELSDKGEMVLTSVAKGIITSVEASNLMSAISNQARIIEVDELERRVAELETRSETG